MSSKKIAPSIMCAPFFQLEACLSELEESGADLLHLDIMDGDFVQNYTLGTDFVRQLKARAKLPLDIHLMMDGSERVEVAPPDTLEQFQSVPENDFYAYRGEGHYKMVLSPGDFLVVFPADAHKIKMQVDGPCPVTKAVFKIKVR